MTESVHIPEAMITCTISDHGDLTLQVFIPNVRKGSKGFTIHNGKVVSGSIPWRSLNPNTPEKEEVRLVTTKRNGGLAICEDCEATLISPYDGQPYYCQECSVERDRES